MKSKDFRQQNITPSTVFQGICANEGVKVKDFTLNLRLYNQKNLCQKSTKDVLPMSNSLTLPSVKNINCDNLCESNNTKMETPTTSKLTEKTIKSPLVDRVCWDETPYENQWDLTPGRFNLNITPLRKGRSRWDETPENNNITNKTFPVCTTPFFSSTPFGALGLETPNIRSINTTIAPDQYYNMKHEREMWERNRPLSDKDLDNIIPSEGYKIIPVSNQYKFLSSSRQKIITSPRTSIETTPLYQIPENKIQIQEEKVGFLPEDLPEMKPEDHQFFAKLILENDEDNKTLEHVKERRIMKLLLKIKNGSPPQRRSAFRQITDNAVDLGAKAIFDQLLPILMSPTTEDHERHLMVKFIDRILFKLHVSIRPYVHKILIVIMPMLIDEDYYARVEGREIISNLAKAAGQATMISALRPDIDNTDEYVRNTAARTFAVICCAFGFYNMVPFLKAVTRSKKSWQARHTGAKIVQQLAILVGCGVLPHLNQLIEVVRHGLDDEHQKVRTITALAISALAEASTPYGIESFDPVLRPLWEGIRKQRGKVLAAFLKAIGFIVPLMDTTAQNYYIREVMVVLLREFQTQDEEMIKTVLNVVKQCILADGVKSSFVRTEVLPEFFGNFWQRKSALCRRNYKQVVETTIALAIKVGGNEIISQIKDDLTDNSESYRKMVVETIDKVISTTGVDKLDLRLEEELLDGLLYTYQEHSADDSGWVIFNCFVTVINELKLRAKPYLPQICGTIKWRINNKVPKVRQQSADLVTRMAEIIYTCGEIQLLQHLGRVIFECLGEEYPDVLGSFLDALKSILNVLGIKEMKPEIRNLLPCLIPIIKNRFEKVQENCIDLIGRIADRGAELIPNREWMRVCFDLLDLLKAPKKAIRRAAVNTFGYIAKAIGPHDVLITLLNNLKVQERQNRVCTTVAIAILSETCFPFTVLPALMNEYKLPENNVQNGVLKSISFMFEYIGEMGKDYVYPILPLLENALTDRDIVHRQTAAFAIQHISLSLCGLGCEDALVHLLNHLWPNIFETSLHMIQALHGAIEGLRVSLGPSIILSYLLQGLFHPAKRVRELYWRFYNNLYIGSQDALVAFFPPFLDSAVNLYRRRELDTFL
jgi:splicing factor 3B subunit 1